MRKTKQLAVWLLVSALVTGCGTLFTGSTAEVSFTTDPKDAAIYLDNRFLGKGSATAVLSRSMMNGSPMVRVERQGYKTQEFHLKTKFNSVSLFNLTSAPSWTTDFVTGAMFEYAPNQYHIQLLRSDSASLGAEQRVAQFVMMNFATLRHELAAGRGEAIDSVIGFAARETGADAALLRHTLMSERRSLVRLGSPLELADAVGRLLAPQTTDVRSQS